MKIKNRLLLKFRIFASLHSSREFNHLLFQLGNPFCFRYHVQLFEEMRNTQTVSVWPVGLAGGLMVEKPKLGDSPTGDSKQVKPS